MKILLLFISFISTTLFAQENLIINGSFEEYSDCPVENNLYQGELEKCTGWWGAFMTPDYMNACSFNPALVSVPHNFGGYQEAFDGDSYIHLAGLTWQKSNGAYTESEYIQTKLSVPLLPCVTYSLSFYIALANWSTVNTQKMSVAFSKDSSYYCDQSSACTQHPPVDEVLNFELSMVTDTVNWYRVDTVFTVSDTYQYLTIGDFLLTLEDTVYLQESTLLPTYDYAFFYIDSIQLSSEGVAEDCEEKSITVPNVFTPNNDQVNDYIDFSDFDKVTIVNRWGNTVLIMESQSNFEWHGKNFREEDLPDGVYYYSAEKDGYKQQGVIHLVR